MLDLDRRALLWFGGEDPPCDLDLRRALLELQRRVWRGWRVDWAHAGIADLAAAVGVPAGCVDSGRDRVRPLDVSPRAAEHGRTLVSIVHGGRRRFGRSRCEGGTLLNGPGALAEPLTALATHETLAWEGRPPTGGVHLDRDRSILHHWWTRDVPFLEREVAAAWPGWRTVWLRDRREAHLELVHPRATIAPRDPVEVREEILAALRSHLDLGSRGAKATTRDGAAALDAKARLLADLGGTASNGC